MSSPHGATEVVVNGMIVKMVNYPLVSAYRNPNFEGTDITFETLLLQEKAHMLHVRTRIAPHSS